MKLMLVLLVFLSMAIVVTAMACVYEESIGRLTGCAATLVFCAVLGLLRHNQRKQRAGKRAAE